MLFRTPLTYIMRTQNHYVFKINLTLCSTEEEKIPYLFSSWMLTIPKKRKKKEKHLWGKDECSWSHKAICPVNHHSSVFSQLCCHPGCKRKRGTGHFLLGANIICSYAAGLVHFSSSQLLCSQWPKLGNCPVLKTQVKNNKKEGGQSTSSTVKIAGIIIRLLFLLDLSQRVSDKTFSKWTFKPQGRVFLSERTCGPNGIYSREKKN